MESTIKSRKRIRSGHRWTDKETECFINAVEQEILKDPEGFEKPTGEKFYTKLRNNNELLKNLDWRVIKAKWRHLKQLYNTAVQWMTENSDLLIVDCNGDLRRRIEKSCPFYYKIDEISSISKSKTLKNVCDADDLQKIESNSTLAIDEFEARTKNTLQTPKTDAYNDVLLNTSSKITPPKDVKLESTAKKRKVDSLAALVTIQRTRLKRDEHISKLKLEADKSRWREELELEKQKLELKRNLLESNERIAMARIEMEMKEKVLRIEMEERIKRYEIEMKNKENKTNIYNNK